MNRVRLGRPWSLLVLGAVAVLPVLIACGSKDKPADSPPPTGSMGMQQPPPGGYPPGYPGAPPGYPGAPPTAYPPATGPTAPATAPTPSASGSGDLGKLISGLASAIPGIFVPPGQNPADLGEAGLKLSATRWAPGMTPEGNMLKQNLTEGQHVEMMVPMQAGKCYTVIGYSAPGQVRDLDLNMMHPLSLPPYTQVFAKDSTTDGNPILFGGQAATCPVSPIPLQYKLDIHARAGSGQVLVQVYSKTK